MANSLLTRFLDTKPIEVIYSNNMMGNLIKVLNMDRGVGEPHEYEMHQWAISSLLRRLKEGGVKTIDEAILVMDALNERADYDDCFNEVAKAQNEVANLRQTLNATNETKEYLLKEIGRLKAELDNKKP